jgi:hypothetical protein
LWSSIPLSSFLAWHLFKRGTYLLLRGKVLNGPKSCLTRRFNGSFQYRWRPCFIAVSRLQNTVIRCGYLVDNVCWSSRNRNTRTTAETNRDTFLELLIVLQAWPARHVR